MAGAALTLAGAAAMLAAPAPAPDYQAEVERAIFEHCPKVLDGALSIDDQAALATIGYGATPPRQTPGGTIPRSARGTGQNSIVLSGHNEADGGTCSVWFGGQDNKGLFKAIRKKARKSGFSGGDRPARLGDGTDIYTFRRASARRSLVFIAGAAGDSIGPYPTTTAVVMDLKGD